VSEKHKDFVQPHNEGCTITIDASPGAKATAIAGVNRWRGSLQVKVAAQAQEGEANEELVRFLSDKLGVERASITILKGERSHHKTLWLPLKPDKVRSLLAVE